MEFLIDYWAVLLIALILILLVLLAYLIDKETKKIGKENRASFKLKEKEEIKNDASVLKNDDITEQAEYNELAYDELDIENIDDEFNKIVPKKKIIDDSIKESIEQIRLDPLKFDNTIYETDIELPDIRLKKEKRENLLGK